MIWELEAGQGHISSNSKPFIFRLCHVASCWCLESSLFLQLFSNNWTTNMDTISVCTSTRWSSATTPPSFRMLKLGVSRCNQAHVNYPFTPSHPHAARPVCKALRTAKEDTMDLDHRKLSLMGVTNTDQAQPAMAQRGHELWEPAARSVVWRGDENQGFWKNRCVNWLWRVIRRLLGGGQCWN